MDVRPIDMASSGECDVRQAGNGNAGHALVFKEAWPR
jgi:hypothetical protein